MDSEGKYGTVRGHIGSSGEISDRNRKYFTAKGKLDSEGYYWTQMEIIGQRGEILDRE